MELVNDKDGRIERFQRATGTSVAVAIAYLEAEEFDVEHAIWSFLADKRAKKGCDKTS